MSKNDLKLEERILIEKYLSEGMNFSEIAKKINRSSCCVAKEIRINITFGNYCAHKIHNNYLKKRELRFCEKPVTQEIKDSVVDLFEKGFSKNKVREILNLSHKKITSIFLEAGIDHRKQKNNVTTMMEKIVFDMESLKEQIAILAEQIKGMKKNEN